ncbi:MAG: HD domain-containing protein [Thermotogaceae bacterium]|nr:HD domain-containing protein [Thermotogaceae bacterium]
MTVLVVDDEKIFRGSIKEHLEEDGHKILEATNGVEALRCLEENKDIDVVLIDVGLSAIEGITAISEIRKKGIPVIVIVVASDFNEEVMEKAAKAGADDFLGKPVDYRMLSIRLKMMERHRHFYKVRIRERTKMLHDVENLMSAVEKIGEITGEEKKSLMEELIRALHEVVEYRDHETYGHTVRVGWISARIAQKLGMNEKDVEAINLAAPLHDIGKIGVPDSILLKVGPLDEKEFEMMKRHTIIGYNILKDTKSHVLQKAAIIAYTHHERWDGSGYPRGLKGNEIPIEGAIVAVADSFDAMTSPRRYKLPMPFDDAFDEIIKLSGVFYNPEVVGAFKELKEEIYGYYVGKYDFIL